VAASGAGVPLVVALERLDGSLSRYDTVAFPEGHPRADANLRYAERLVKFLLWPRGGWRAIVGGPPSVGEHIRRVYAADGERSFDYHFMGEQVHGRQFKVTRCAAQVVPASREAGQHLGRHLDGCRIGFDLGASDLKCRRWSTARRSSARRSCGSRSSRPTRRIIGRRSARR